MNVLSEFDTFLRLCTCDTEIVLSVTTSNAKFRRKHDANRD